jgi:hypothetical protein
MTATTIPGSGIWIPSWYGVSGAGANVSANVTVDAANESCHFIGYVSLAGRSGSKTISSSGGKIHWTTGTSITFANGATNLRIGIQDVDTAGPPGRGDGTFDVYADLVGGTDTITADAWMTTAMESGTKTITHGDLVCIALTTTARGGADSVLVRYSLLATQTVTTVNSHFPQVTAVTSGPTYTAQNGVPVVLIEFDDGTFGFIDGALVLKPAAATAFYTNNSIDSGTDPDEYALIFEFPVPVTIDALSCLVNPETSSSDFELILYSDPEGTPSAIETLTIDANQAQTSMRQVLRSLATPRDLTANTKYAVAIRPTTANNVSVLTISVNDASHWDAHTLNQDAYLGTRKDQTGAFGTTATSRIYASVRAIKFDDGTGSGGQRIFGG